MPRTIVIRTGAAPSPFQGRHSMPRVAAREGVSTDDATSIVKSRGSMPLRSSPKFSGDETGAAWRLQVLGLRLPLEAEPRLCSDCNHQERVGHLHGNRNGQVVQQRKGLRLHHT